MLENIFHTLDLWINQENAEAERESTRPLGRCEFKVLGQTALLEAALRLDLTATGDVDAFSNASYAIKTKLNDLLKDIGLQLDPLSDQIWMPEETRYVPIYRGQWVTALRAEPLFVLLSKAHKAPARNKNLLRQYLAQTPTPEFFTLCQKYQVDLGALVETGGTK